VSAVNGRQVPTKPVARNVSDADENIRKRSRPNVVVRRSGRSKMKITRSERWRDFDFTDYRRKNLRYFEQSPSKVNGPSRYSQRALTPFRWIPKTNGSFEPVSQAMRAAVRLGIVSDLTSTRQHKWRTFDVQAERKKRRRRTDINVDKARGRHTLVIIVPIRTLT